MIRKCLFAVWFSLDQDNTVSPCTAREKLFPIGIFVVENFLLFRGQHVGVISEHIENGLFVKRKKPLPYRVRFNPIDFISRIVLVKLFT